MSPRKLFKYSERSLEDAIHGVLNSGIPIREAARKFNVPRTTLTRKINGTAPMRRKMGPSTIIPEDEEELLKRYVIATAKRGFPVRKRRLLLLAEEIAGKKVKNKWFSLFLKRHDVIKVKRAESINQARAAVTEQSIRKWHASLEDYLVREYGATTAHEILNDPTRMANSDETGFMTNPKSGLVLGPASDKNFFEVKVGNEKEQITTLLTISADGDVFEPWVVLPYERVPAKVAEAYEEVQCRFGNSKSGWMTQEVYLRFLKESFLPALNKKKVKFPILYLVDGHRSHLGREVVQFCEDNGIILYSFRPNATHILQAADLTLFKSLKHNWACVVEAFKKENQYQPITKVLFAKLLMDSISKVTSDTVRNGFRKSGIFPFNADAIDYSKCMEHRSRTIEYSGIQLKPAVMGYEHLLYMESCMKPGRALEFRRSYVNGGEWNGEESAEELYKVWFKMRKVVSGEDANKVATSTLANTAFKDADSEENREAAIDSSTDAPITGADALFSSAACDVSPDNGNVVVSGAPTADADALLSSTFYDNSPNNADAVDLSWLNNVSGSSKISPTFYNAVNWPSDTPPKKNKQRVMKFPRGTGGRRFLEFYSERDEENEKREEEKIAKIEEKKRQREIKNKEKRKKKQRKLSDTDQSDLDSMKGLDGDSADDLVDWDASQDSLTSDENGMIGEVDIGSFVLSKFVGGKRGKTEFRYVCVVQNIVEDGYVVQGLRSTDSKKKRFKIKTNDICVIGKDQITKLLPPPESIDRKEVYIFKKRIDVYEV